jgi:RES domain-containing protein
VASSRRRARDPELIDALDARTRTTFDGTLWRVVREGRDPLEASRAGGRWDLGASDVLYTSMEPDCAIAEVEYHLSQQPVFPSRIRSAWHELRARVSSVIRLETIAELVDLGVDAARYREPLYERTREIGDAAAFLGCDALIVPSARWDCLNVVLFLEAIELGRIETLSGVRSVDWKARRTNHASRKR